MKTGCRSADMPSGSEFRSNRRTVCSGRFIMHQLQLFAITPREMHASQLPRASSRCFGHRAKERTGFRFQRAVASLPIVGRLPRQVAQDISRCRAKLDLRDEEEAASKTGLKPEGELNGGPSLPWPRQPRLPESKMLPMRRWHAVPHPTHDHAPPEKENLCPRRPVVTGRLLTRVPHASTEHTSPSS